MSHSTLRGLAATYRRLGGIFGVSGHVGPMLAHADAASLLDRTACAVEAADYSTAHLEWLGEASAVLRLAAFYQPVSSTVVVWTGEHLVSFDEDEAEALCASLQDALAARRLGRTLLHSDWVIVPEGQRLEDVLPKRPALEITQASYPTGTAGEQEGSIMARAKKEAPQVPDQVSGIEPVVPAKAPRRLVQDGGKGAHPIHMVPLSDLCLSDRNVRKTNKGAYIESLATDIAANGLKQNLVVVSEGIVDPANGLTAFRVIAGGRRFQALQLLVNRGEIRADHEVPVLIESSREAVSTSLSENLHKVAMNPVDEFEAFHQIVGETMECDGLDREAAIAACGRRFGRTAAHVAGRLRLAELHPEILTALREDRIGFESAKAYATVSDQALQIGVFNAREKQKWGDKHAPAFVRIDLRAKSYSVDCCQMLYVGQEAYLAAGGRIEGELFMGEKGENRALDVALLDKLANDKAKVEVDALALADGWKEGVLFTPFGKSARKPPEGFEARSYYGLAAEWIAPAELTPEQRAECIGHYSVDELYADEDGEGEAVGAAVRLSDDWCSYWRPKSEAIAPSASPPMTDEERAARRREEQRNEFAELHAARLAVGKFTDTRFDGRAWWPGGRWVEPLAEGAEGRLLVAVWIEIDEGDAKARLDEAYAEFDRREADAKAKADADADAQAVGDVDDDDDDEVDEAA